MSRTLIDYVSFSGSPLILERCKDMAKQRFMIGRSPYQFQSYNDVAVAGRERDQINHFAENLAQVLGCVESENYANKDLYFEALADQLQDADLHIAQDKSFNDCYQELIANLGIDMLDVLCHGEVESFLELLQHELSYDGNIWTTERRGGFSGYRYSAKLLCNGIQAGMVAWGASNFGYYVSFSGKGCEALNFEKLHYALKQMAGTKLTRVDLALDDLQGNVSISSIDEPPALGRVPHCGTSTIKLPYRRIRHLSDLKKTEGIHHTFLNKKARRAQLAPPSVASWPIYDLLRLQLRMRLRRKEKSIVHIGPEKLPRDIHL